MESGAKGCEVVVSGKLRAARAKSMKFTVRLFLPWGADFGCDAMRNRILDPLETCTDDK